jgi:plasmid stabilization system protein ParE
MAKPVEFLVGAQGDFDESIDWYSRRSTEAAIRFAAVEEVTEEIGLVPLRYPKTSAGCRYCKLRRFPFHLVFREDPDRIAVVAVAHGKRRQNYWRGRA